jgi:hypothetical protein
MLGRENAWEIETGGRATGGAHWVLTGYYWGNTGRVSRSRIATAPTNLIDSPRMG